MVIEDDAGYCLPSGLIMLMVKTAINAAIQTNPNISTASLLDKINRTIYDNILKMDEKKYMTLTVLACHENGVFHFSGLHQDIFIYRAKKKELELIPIQGMWVYLMEDISGMVHLMSLFGSKRALLEMVELGEVVILM